LNGKAWVVEKNLMDDIDWMLIENMDNLKDVSMVKRHLSKL